MTIRFDYRISIITCAGGSLGCCHAFELACRGAKVVGPILMSLAALSDEQSIST